MVYAITPTKTDFFLGGDGANGAIPSICGEIGSGLLVFYQHQHYPIVNGGIHIKTL